MNDDSSSDSSDSSDLHRNTFGLYDTRPRKGDYLKYKTMISRKLRVGGACHLGRNVNSKIDSSMKIHDKSSCRRLFNLLMHRELGSFPPRHHMYMGSFSTSPNGMSFQSDLLHFNRRCACKTYPYSFKNSVQSSLWTVSRFHLHKIHEHHTGCVNTVAFTECGDVVASGSDDLRIVLCNWYNDEILTRIPSGHHSNIFHLLFVPKTNNLQLVTCACDGQIRLTQLKPDGCRVSSERLVRHRMPAHKLSIPSGEPSTVLSAGADGQVYACDLRSNNFTLLLSLHPSEFFYISSNPVKPYEFILSGRNEAIVRIFDRRKVSYKFPAKAHICSFGADRLIKSHVDDDKPTTSALSSGDVDGDGSPMSSLLPTEHSLRMMPARLGNRRGVSSSAHRHCPCQYQESSFSVTSAVYSKQGDAVILSYNDEDIYLFDVTKPSPPCLHCYTGHRNMQTIVSANFYGPRSEYVMSGSDDGYLYIWDRESEGIVQWLRADLKGAVNVVESHPTLPVIATCGLDHDYKIWLPSRPMNADSIAYSDLKTLSSSVELKRLRKSNLAEAILTDTSPQQSTLSNGCVQENEESDKSPTSTMDVVSSAQKRPTPESTVEASSVSQSSNNGRVVDCKRPCLDASCSADSDPPVANCVPQHLVPFELSDLKLRAAQNWINREEDILNLNRLSDANTRLLSALQAVAQIRTARLSFSSDSTHSTSSISTTSSNSSNSTLSTDRSASDPSSPAQSIGETNVSSVLPLRRQRRLGNHLTSSSSSSSDSDDLSSLSSNGIRVEMIDSDGDRLTDFSDDDQQRPVN